MLGSKFYDVNIYKCAPDHQSNHPVLVLVLEPLPLKTEEERRTNFPRLMSTPWLRGFCPFYFLWVFLPDQNRAGNHTVILNTSLSEPASIIYNFLVR